MFVGMVVGGRGSPRCGQPVGRRSSIGPCMSGQFGVGRRACGLFMVTSCPLQWFCWYAVVLAASWSVCSALVPWPCCAQVLSLLRCWLMPVAWGRHARFLLCTVSPPWGRKVMISGLTAVKLFSNSVPFSLPRPGSVACTTLHLVLRGALWPCFEFSLCHLYAHPPSVARPRRSPSVCPPAPNGSPRGLFRLSGAVLMLLSACLRCAIWCRVLRVMWLFARRWVVQGSFFFFLEYKVLCIAPLVHRKASPSYKW